MSEVPLHLLLVRRGDAGHPTRDSPQARTSAQRRCERLGYLAHKKQPRASDAAREACDDRQQLAVCVWVGPPFASADARSSAEPRSSPRGTPIECVGGTPTAPIAPMCVAIEGGAPGEWGTPMSRGWGTPSAASEWGTPTARAGEASGGSCGDCGESRSTPFCFCARENTLTVRILLPSSWDHHSSILIRKCTLLGP